MGVAADEAEDVQQEVFIVAHRRIDQLRAEGEARPWLAAIARRVSSDYRRAKAGRRRRHSALASERRGMTDRGLDIQRTEVAQVLAPFLEQLDEESMTLFRYFEIEQRTGREISKLTGLNINTLFTKRRSLRRRLRAFMDTIDADSSQLLRSYR